MRLQNKVAIVTGGGSGIGEATAILLAKEGAKVVIADLDETGGHATVQTIEANGGAARFEKLDVADEDNFKAVVENSIDTYGKLDILVNNAGLSSEQKKLPFVEQNEWDKVVDVCLRGVFNGMKFALPEMEKNENGGSIINIASVAGLRGLKYSTPYSAAKSGVLGITQSAASEFGNKKVRVNAIAPGIIETPIIAKWKETDSWEIRTQANALRRLGQPIEIANGVLFLASDESSFVTGTTLVIDGGSAAGK